MRAITYPELKPRKGVPFTRQHIDRLEKAGRFPKRFKLGANTNAWDEDEIDRWMAERKGASDARAA